MHMGYHQMTTGEPDTERRHFFRINQDVIFDYHPVDIHTVNNSRPEDSIGEGSAMDLVTALRKIDRDAHSSLRMITERDRLLGDYLAKLSQKIDLIARHCVFAGQPELKSSRLNISEGGIAFRSTRPLYKDAFIVVRLIFLPTYAAIVVFARVIRCDELENEYRIATEFHQLAEPDRQLLARENLRAQVRHRKQSPKAGE